MSRRSEKINSERGNPVGGVAREFIETYNRARPSQATHAIPDPYPELNDRPLAGGKLIALPVLGGVQHDDRLAA